MLKAKSKGCDTLAMYIKAARVDAELTQAKTANALGISKSTYASYENYKTSPDINMAKRIARLFGRPVDEIRWG